MINSQEWWTEEHKHNWVNVGINGIEQTRYFAAVLIGGLHKADFQLYGYILDYGCALGQMVAEINNHCPECNITGYDFSKTAIDKAKLMYPDLEFTSELPVRQYDIVISSNVLEHYSDPIEEMRNHLKLAKGYYIAMTPYKDPVCDIHPAMIDENSLPHKIDGFRLETIIIVPTTNPCLCYCSQIIFIYKRYI